LPALVITILSCRTDVTPELVKKEFIEITHAAGYEHPCQFNMDDIDVNVDDHHLSKELGKTYMYHKTVVPFEGVQSLKDCRYLGGRE